MPVFKMFHTRTTHKLTLEFKILKAVLLPREACRPLTSLLLMPNSNLFNVRDGEFEPF